MRAEGEIFTGGADVNVFDGLSVEDAEDFIRRLLSITHDLEALPIPRWRPCTASASRRASSWRWAAT